MVLFDVIVISIIVIDFNIWGIFKNLVLDILLVFKSIIKNCNKDLIKD